MFSHTYLLATNYHSNTANVHLFLRISASVYAPHDKPDTAYTDLSPAPCNTHTPKQYTYTNLDFTGARDDGVAVASAGPYANHLHLAPER